MANYYFRITFEYDKEHVAVPHIHRCVSRVGNRDGSNVRMVFSVTLGEPMNAAGSPALRAAWPEAEPTIELSRPFLSLCLNLRPTMKLDACQPAMQTQNAAATYTDHFVSSLPRYVA